MAQWLEVGARPSIPQVYIEMARGYIEEQRIGYLIPQPDCNFAGTEMGHPIYLDGFAALPLAPEARDAMLAVWAHPGNASSPNVSGEIAARTIADGRGSVADLIGATANEITFTSGATEANNLAILGVARAARGLEPNRRRVLVSAIEHKAVLEPAQALKSEGFEISIAPVDHRGRLDLAEFARLVDQDLLLASVMMVNNETGVIQPVKEAAALAHLAPGFEAADGRLKNVWPARLQEDFTVF